MRLAHAAAKLAAGRRVWASADVHSSSVWLRQEAQRCAAADASEWPRLLTSAEEWLLWREYAAAATRRFALVNGGALAASLQHSSELAAHYGIALTAGYVWVDHSSDFSYNGGIDGNRLALYQLAADITGTASTTMQVMQAVVRK